MCEQLASLKEKVTTLKGAAKVVVERKIAELEAKHFDPCVNNLTLTELLEQSVVLVDELELSLANLENRLSSVMPDVTIGHIVTSSTEKAPTAIARAIEVNKTLRLAINKTNSITDQIRL